MIIVPLGAEEQQAVRENQRDLVETVRAFLEG
jgi:hypothetical protein